MFTRHLGKCLPTGPETQQAGEYTLIPAKPLVGAGSYIMHNTTAEPDQYYNS